MQKLLERIKIEVTPKLYIKNPQQTTLGKRILKESVDLMDKLGYDDFTFKKLAERLETAESSVYRYFENKNRLVLYFMAWYWEMQEYRLVFLTGEAHSSDEKFKIALELFFDTPKSKNFNADFDSDKVWHIISSESFKACLVREQDPSVRSEIIKLYQRVITRYAEIIKEINMNVTNAELVASLIIEGVTDYNFYHLHHKKSLPAFANENEARQFFVSFYLNSIKHNQ